MAPGGYEYESRELLATRGHALEARIYAVFPTANYAQTIGAAWGDLDNDGHFDLFVGNFAHPGQPWP